MSAPAAAHPMVQQYHAAQPAFSPNSYGPMKNIHIYVPNTYIGAVIGFKGAYIKTLQNTTTTNICVDTGVFHLPATNAACVAQKVANSTEKDSSAKSVEEFGSEVADHALKDGITAACTKDTNGSVEKKLSRFANLSLHEDPSRQVQISGSAENLMKAMFWIFQRVAEVCETPLAAVKLHVDFTVPEDVVGLIIGRNGQNIAQLKRISRGCDIHVNSHDEVEATVCLFGPFHPCLTVACRINHLLKTANSQKTRPHNGHPHNSPADSSARRRTSGDAQQQRPASNTSPAPAENGNGAAEKTPNA
ncbi:hypothetical protein M3Y99_01352700 [Aphelenchoides fujianensis]|nr:hypothetical protein M3Y99_01352700 [Aphelenchoides fujianensis]